MKFKKTYCSEDIPRLETHKGFLKKTRKIGNRLTLHSKNKKMIFDLLPISSEQYVFFKFHIKDTSY